MEVMHSNYITVTGDSYDILLKLFSIILSGVICYTIIYFNVYNIHKL